MKVIKTVVLSDDQENIINNALRERLSQDAKWGIQNHDQPMWQMIDDEENGEVAQAYLKLLEAMKLGDEALIAHWRVELRKELVQHVAVTVSRFECAIRNGLVELPSPEGWSEYIAKVEIGGSITRNNDY